MLLRNPDLASVLQRHRPDRDQQLLPRSRSAPRSSKRSGGAMASSRRGTSRLTARSGSTRWPSSIAISPSTSCRRRRRASPRAPCSPGFGDSTATRSSRGRTSSPRSSRSATRATRCATGTSPTRTSRSAPLEPFLDPMHAIADAGGHPRDGGDTIYLCAADEHGNLVSLIQSVAYDFGSGIVAEGTGMLLQNRGCYFKLDPGARQPARAEEANDAHAHPGDGRARRPALGDLRLDGRRRPAAAADPGPDEPGRPRSGAGGGGGATAGARPGGWRDDLASRPTIPAPASCSRSGLDDRADAAKAPHARPRARDRGRRSRSRGAPGPIRGRTDRSSDRPKTGPHLAWV